MNAGKEVLMELIKLKIKNHRCPDCYNKSLQVKDVPWYKVEGVQEYEDIYITCTTGSRDDGDDSYLCPFESTWNTYRKQNLDPNSLTTYICRERTN